MNSVKNPHHLCIACMGVKHAQVLLANTNFCKQCYTGRIPEQCLQVLVISKIDPHYFDTKAKPSNKPS